MGGGAVEALAVRSMATASRANRRTFPQRLGAFLAGAADRSDFFPWTGGLLLGRMKQVEVRFHFSDTHPLIKLRPWCALSPLPAGSRRGRAVPARALLAPWSVRKRQSLPCEGREGDNGVRQRPLLRRLPSVPVASATVRTILLASLDGERTSTEGF
jgi:hypothetical protein